MPTRHLICVLVVATAVLVVPAATAKSFGPGDLRVCGADRCVAITKPAVLPLFGAFYYHGISPRKAPRPRLGAPAFELRFRNGYVTGIVASPWRDRFLSYGVNIGHFHRGTWYRLPRRAAAELRRRSAQLEPLRVTPTTLARSR